MSLLKKFVTKEEHEEIMSQLDDQEEELQEIAERVRQLEIEAGIYDREGEVIELGNRRAN